MADGTKRQKKGPSKAVLILIAVVILLVAAGVGSTAYVSAFRAEREPSVVVVATTPDMAADVERLGQAFRAAYPGEELKVVASAPPLDGVLASGQADLVLAVARLDAGVTFEPWLAFRQARVLSVDFPSAHTAVTLDEAAKLVAALDKGAALPATWADTGLEVIDLADRNSARQLLEVDGIYPSLETVQSGVYPLTYEVRLAKPKARGLLGLLTKVSFLDRRAHPNAAAISDFVDWLGTDDAKAAFYGTPYEITLSAAGDTMLARGSQRQIDANGLDYPFEFVADRLGSADITWCNLECALGVTGTPIPGKEIWLRAKPECVQCLQKAGFDVVSAANNHILDYDTPSLLETLDILDAAGIRHAGAGKNIDEARAPAVLEVTPRIVVGGVPGEGAADEGVPAGEGAPAGEEGAATSVVPDKVRVAFLSYTEFADSWLFWDVHYRRTFLAEENVPGCAPLDMTMVAEDIAKAKEEADIVVVTYHWGLEDIPYPQAFQPKNDLEAIARKTIDLGASLVLGTHPHIVQGLEAYNGGLVHYSIGNFVDDQRQVTQNQGTILEVRLGPKGVLSARVVPVKIVATRPMVMEGAEAQALLQTVETVSQIFKDHK